MDWKLFLHILFFFIVSVFCESEKKEFVRSRYNPRVSSTTQMPPTSEDKIDTKLETNRLQEIVKAEKNNINEKFECGEQYAENHPWVAVIEHTDPTMSSKKKTLSKGVLVAPQWVLTTVSSLHNTYPFWVVSNIRLGDSPTWALTTVSRHRNSTVRVGIEEVFMHESKDIALIKLNRKVKITDKVRPICLPDDDNYNFRELYGHICKRIPGTPMHERAKVSAVAAAPLSPQDCHILFHRKGAEFGREEFCAWDERGDSCTGDLGGPLVAKSDGRFYVIGLTSYAQGTNNLDSDTLPGVYTRVGSHLSWVKKLIKEGK